MYNEFAFFLSLFLISRQETGTVEADSKDKAGHTVQNRAYQKALALSIPLSPSPSVLNYNASVGIPTILIADIYDDF
jgi:hypothetical protein